MEEQKPKGGRIIIEQRHFQLILQRLAHQLIEKFDDFSDTVMIGLQPRGVILAEGLAKILREDLQIQDLKLGKLDITFYRDDFRRREKPLEAYVTDIDFLVEGKNVILVDDVLYTGRTVQAGLTALNHYGRPKSVELLTLIDRQFNRHLPIESTFTGMQIDAVDEAYVYVDWEDNLDGHQVILFDRKEEFKQLMQ
ncbi:MAG: bifunctional pyr operon transcriptional regulator/uracil phosphoribosyltransferase PyrR [Bacteroidota bacterium]